MNDDQTFRPLNDDERMGSEPVGDQNEDGAELVTPVPLDAPEPSTEGYRVGPATGWWTYHNVKGETLFHVMRFDPPGAPKEIRPLTLWRDPRSMSLRWRWKAHPEPRPLYRLHLLAARPDAPVLICEGEKSADAAKSIFPDHVAMTSPGGAMASAKADWAPLAGRAVVVWPDHDQAGAGYALSIAQILIGLGSTVSIIDVARLVEIDGGKHGPERETEGWDAADALEEWADAEALREAALGLAAPYCDPLEDLVARTRTDPAAPYAPEALAMLAKLKREDRGKFEAWRARLKQAGCRVTGLEAALKALSEDDGEGSRKPNQTDRLVALAGDAALFHAPDKKAFADMTVNGHRETWAIRAPGFGHWLRRRYLHAYNSAPNSDAMASALNMIEALAFDGPEQLTYLRVASFGDKMYLDLADAEWRAIEIDAAGRREVNDPPVRFRRSAGMLPLPVPERGGSINELRQFVNVRSDADFILLIAFALKLLRDEGAYPVLGVGGEQGSSKSTVCLVLKELIDPNAAPLRALPREELDLYVTATHSHILVYDNVSGLPWWLPDAFSRLATGAGAAKRGLYTDADEVLLQAKRPVLINGIVDVVTQPDLVDRAAIFALERIADEARKTEVEFWAAFRAARPRILGALLDIAVVGLNNLAKTRPPGLSRMADFEVWSIAFEPAYAPKGAFLEAYVENRETAQLALFDSDRVAGAVRAHMDGREKWEGTATALLKALNDAQPTFDRFKDWPKDASVLGGRVRRAAPALRKAGISVEYGREGNSRSRTIALSRSSLEEGNLPSAPSASPEKDAKDRNSKELDEDSNADSNADSKCGGVRGVRVRDANANSNADSADSNADGPLSAVNQLISNNIKSLADRRTANSPSSGKPKENTNRPKREHAIADVRTAISPQESAPREKSPDETQAGPVAVIFRINKNSGGWRTQRCADPADAVRLIDEVLAGADGPVAVDLETAPLPSETARLRGLEQERAEIASRLGEADAPSLEAEIKRLDAAIAYAETAGLDPRRSRIRLLQLCAGSDFILVVDLDRVGCACLQRLNGVAIVAHNAGFELKFLEQAGVKPGKIDCTMQGSRLLFGVMSLEKVARESLNVILDKTEQTSDWNAPELREEQFVYAAMDARVCWRLSQTILPALGPQKAAYAIQTRAIPAVAHMESRGFKLDLEAHAALLQALSRERLEAREAYAQACVDGGQPNLAVSVPSTPQQKIDLLQKLLTSEELMRWRKTPKSSALSTRRNDLRRAAHYPPIAALMTLGAIDKMLNAFGPTLAASVSPADGRIHAHYTIAKTASGRAACSDPNLQQIPRDPRFRALFVPEPGNMLIVADYSSMELRAAAHIAGDAAMLAAFEQDLDLHRITAAAMASKRIEDITSEERRAAKAVNFGALYGIGAVGLAGSAWEGYGLVIAEDEAARWLKTFEAAYPKFARWRREHARRCESRGSIIIGRDAAQGLGRLFPKSRVPEGASFYTRCCNLAIQGACADASMLALTAIDRALEQERLAGGPVAWLHDEIVLEVPAEHANRAAELLRDAMLSAFRETFPGATLKGLVKPRIVADWGEAKD
jgi:DNA polymerase I-like protein with 3'-5' exonuclease and polymerase domains